MSARYFPVIGLAVITALSGCAGHGASPSGSAAPAGLPAAPAASPAAVAPVNPPATAAPAVSQAPQEPDDASLLARKTSEYARHMSQVLNQSDSAPASRPSEVQWLEPSARRAELPVTGRPAYGAAGDANATLAAAHLLKEDTTVPLILPESADQIPGTAPTAAPKPVADSTDDYELKLRQSVKDYPRDLGSQLDYQLLRLVRDEPTPDLADVAQLSSEDRDILLALMDGLTNFRAAARDNGNLMLNRKIQPLLEMSERLRQQAQLSIPTVAFCTQVMSYGVYDPMPSSRFEAGRNNEAIVYCEAANFTSVQGSDQFWRTRLRQEMVLYTDTGIAVWPEQSDAEMFLDQSRNRRHDFFISRRLTLPSSLAAGKYVLKITLTDEQSNRVVEASAPMELVAPSAPVEAAPASDHVDSALPSLTP